MFVIGSSASGSVVGLVQMSPPGAWTWVWANPLDSRSQQINSVLGGATALSGMIVVYVNKLSPVQRWLMLIDSRSGHLQGEALLMTPGGTNDLVAGGNVASVSWETSTVSTATPT